MATVACSLATEVREHMWNIIIHDLNAFGIKVRAPTQFERKRKTATPVAHDGKVFGVPLADQLTEDVSTIGRVPNFLVRARTVLEKSLKVEGLFRKTGSMARQRELKALVDAGGLIPDDVFVHDVTSLVKQFLRELPEPLIPAHLVAAFIQAGCHKEPYERIRLLLLVCLMMPPDHLEALTFTAHLLTDVADQAEHNKMNSNNLALCLAPNFFHGTSSEPVCTKMVGSEAAVVEELINNAHSIGVLPDLLYEQVLMIDMLPDDPVGGGHGLGDDLSDPAAAVVDWRHPAPDTCSLDTGSVADRSTASKDTVKRSSSLGSIFKSIRRSWASLTKKDSRKSCDATAEPPLASKRKADGDSPPLGGAPAPKKRKALWELNPDARDDGPAASTRSRDPESKKSANAKKCKSPFKLLHRKRSLSQPAASEGLGHGSPLTSACRRGAGLAATSPAMGCDPHVGHRLAHIQHSSSRAGQKLTSDSLPRVDSADQPRVRPSSITLPAALGAPWPCAAAGGSAAHTPIGSDRREPAAEREATALLMPALFPLHMSTLGGGYLVQHEPPLLHRRRADLMPSGDLLPSRLRRPPMTPLGAVGSGSSRIDKAQISGPLPMPATAAAAALAEEPASAVAAALTQPPLGGRCQLLSLDEAVALGAGRPCFSPPESPSLFVRVRSFREGQQHRQLVELPAQDGDSSRSCGRAATADTDKQWAVAHGCADRPQCAPSAGSAAAAPATARDEHYAGARGSHTTALTGVSPCSRPCNSNSCCSGDALRPIERDDCCARDRPHDPCATMEGTVTTARDASPTAGEARPLAVAVPTGCSASQPPSFSRGEGVSCTVPDGSCNERPHAGRSISSRHPSTPDDAQARVTGASACQHTGADTIADHAIAVSSPGVPAASAGDEQFTTGSSATGDTAHGVLPSSPAAAQAYLAAPCASAASPVLPPPSSDRPLAGHAEQLPAPPVVRHAGGNATSRMHPRVALKVLGSSSDDGRPAVRESIVHLQQARIVQHSLHREANISDDNDDGGRSTAAVAAAPVAAFRTTGDSGGRSSAASRALDDRKVVPYRHIGESVVRRRLQGLPASALTNGDRGYCAELVKAVVEGQHDDIVSRRTGGSLSSGSRPGRLPAAATTSGTDGQPGGSHAATFVEAAPTLLSRPVLRESNKLQPLAPADGLPKPSLVAAQPRIKQPILLLDGLCSASRRAPPYSQRQLKRLTSSPGAAGSGCTPRRTSVSGPRGTTAQPSRGSPLRPVPCTLSTLASDTDDELDTLV